MRLFSNIRPIVLNAVAFARNPVPLAQRPRRSSPWHHIEAIEFATLEWVDWFNNWQVLTSIGDVPPTEYEQQYYLTQEAPFTVASFN